MHACMSSMSPDLEYLHVGNYPPNHRRQAPEFYLHTSGPVSQASYTESRHRTLWAVETRPKEPRAQSSEDAIPQVLAKVAAYQPLSSQVLSHPSKSISLARLLHQQLPYLSNLSWYLHRKLVPPLLLLPVPFHTRLNSRTMKHDVFQSDLVYPRTFEILSPVNDPLHSRNQQNDHECYNAVIHL